MATLPPTCFHCQHEVGSLPLTRPTPVAVLADEVAARVPAGPVVVLGLARGGVPVAAEVAARLGAPLDVLTVRKIGTPGHVELAIGAMASGGLVVRNDGLIARLGLYGRRRRRRVAVARESSTSATPAARRPATAGADRGHGRARRRRPGHRRDDARRRRRGAHRRRRRTSSSPCPSARRTRSPSWRRRPTTSCARGNRPTSWPSASGTASSARRPMPRSSPCSPIARRPDRRDAPSDDRAGRRASATSTCSSATSTWPAGPGRSPTSSVAAGTPPPPAVVGDDRRGRHDHLCRRRRFATRGRTRRSGPPG